jgi:acid phosphatase
MRFSTSAIVASLASVAIAAPGASPTATDVADVYAAQATAKTESPTSHVKGKVFDRYVSIWFENTDYDMAAADPNFQFFAKKGITLSNLFAVTHPSEPNYMAAVGGYVDFRILNKLSLTHFQRLLWPGWRPIHCGSLKCLIGCRLA